MGLVWAVAMVLSHSEAAAADGLTISKTSDAVACVSPDDTITYTIIVKNTGVVSRVDIAIQDVLPAGVTYVPGSIAAKFSGTNTVVYSSSSSFVVPPGITSITVEAWGGGGGGSTRNKKGAGGGGGGGAYSRSTLEVLAGSTYTVAVGAGGAANTAGGNSWFSLGTVTGVLARGGTGGTQNNEAGALGGAAASGIGVVRYDGGRGANGSGTAYGGGGGSSAGTNAAGISATNATGATAPAGGGNGGNGRSGTSGAGLPGSVPGGGGGGALSTGGGTLYTGGAGANGRVVVTYAQGATGTLGEPPALWSGGSLVAGASVTLTFQVTVDNPGTATQYLNTASASGVDQAAIEASVTNCAAYADVGVQKFATKTAPNPGEIIGYWVVATNSGPDAATGLEITDALPADVQYNSHSNGTYNPLTGIWTIGNLAAGASTTLYINVTVNEGTGGQSIINTATITARELHDPNPGNDTGSVVIVPTVTVSVVLSCFAIADDGGGVVVRWRTASEKNSVGFYVERETGAGRVRVNNEILYAKGEDGFGASYRLGDAGAAVGGTYTYWLREMETDGGQKIYGPFARTALALEMDSSITVGPNGILVRWLSREGETYRVLRSTNLLEGLEGFHVIASGLPAVPEWNEYFDEHVGPVGIYLIQVDDE